MPQSCLLLCGTTVNIATIRRILSPQWPIHPLSGPRQVLIQPEDGEWYVSIVEGSNPNDLLNEYSGYEDLPDGLRHVREATVLVIRFNAFDVVGRILLCILDGLGPECDNCWLDNDHGDLLAGRDVLAGLSAHPEWDWRGKIRSRGD